MTLSTRTRTWWQATAVTAAALVAIALLDRAVLTGGLLPPAPPPAAPAAPAAPAPAAPAPAAPAAAAAAPAAAPAAPDPAQERAAAAVASEDRRLLQVRSLTGPSQWSGAVLTPPYRLDTAGARTLVLTARSLPYTLQELPALAPGAVRQLPDGSFLLSEHVVVLRQATLRLAGPRGLTVRLASGSKGFSSLVSLGGRIEVLGRPAAPVRLSSWDPAGGTPDRRLDDGRAYVRAVGGQFEAHHLTASDLGFWSGRTGGLALTGSDRPDTSALGKVRQGDPPAVADGDPDVDGAGQLTSQVSGTLTRTTVSRNAFGLFVSSAKDLRISDSTVRNSLVGGVVLHRHVVKGVITRTQSLGNAGDGFSLQRGTTGVTLSEVTARRNSGSGITLSGRPLADGASATGLSTRSYGGNSVVRSTSADNGQYGIHVLGGFDVAVQDNLVSGNDMGVVVTGPANRIALRGNEVRHSTRHALALVDGVTDSAVTRNAVDSTATGVYVRDSATQVTGNTVEAARSHGVSLVGQVGGTVLDGNVLSGSGRSALDTLRATGAYTSTGNQVAGWDEGGAWYRALDVLLQPMTALWASIAVLVALSAVRSRSRKQVGTGAPHPYAHQTAHRRAPVDSGTIDLVDHRVSEIRVR